MPSNIRTGAFGKFALHIELQRLFDGFRVGVVDFDSCGVENTEGFRPAVAAHERLGAGGYYALGRLYARTLGGVEVLRIVHDLERVGVRIVDEKFLRAAKAGVKLRGKIGAGSGESNLHWLCPY